MRILKRLSGFTLAVILSAISGLIAIPIIIASVGVEQYGHFAVAQSTAALFGVGVSFGWGVTGPASVAATNYENRKIFFVHSFHARIWLFILLSPVLMVVIAATVGENSSPFGVIGLAYLLPSLGASWYFVGSAMPWHLVLYDTLPRVLGTIVGAVLLYLTENIWTLALAMLIGALVQVVTSLGVVTGFQIDSKGLIRFGSIFRNLLNQSSGVVTAATSALYLNAPILIVSWVNPAATPIYALSDRILKFALTAATPMTQVLQGWVPAAVGLERARRMRRAVLSSALFGAAGGIFLAVAIPFAGSLLSGGKISLGLTLSSAQGATFWAVILSQVVGLACLVALGETRWVAISTMCGAALGVPLVIWLSVVAGAPGVAWAVAASEIAVTVVQLVTLRGALSRSAEG